MAPLLAIHLNSVKAKLHVMINENREECGEAVKSLKQNVAIHSPRRKLAPETTWATNLETELEEEANDQHSETTKLRALIAKQKGEIERLVIQLSEVYQCT